jgi:glycosyltransferase involved in cell wall biosynthesis
MTSSIQSLPHRGHPPLKGPVIIDALAARYGGMAYGTAQLAHHLADDSDLGPIIVVTREGSLVEQDLRPRPGLSLLTLRQPKRFELAWRLLWEGSGLPRLVRRHHASSVLTVSGMLPRPVGAPVVSYLRNALMFERGGAANHLRRWAVRRTARSAKHVLVPSRAMAETVADVIGVRAEVVPLGVDHTRFRPTSKPGADVLCVADFYRHKRQDLLLEAWAALPPPRPRLRLIGDARVDPSWHTRIAAQAARHRDLGNITLSAPLSRDELVDAYHRARVFALASEYESFCFPVLEAQACGIPAVVRDIPVLRETGGRMTTYIAGDDPETWAAALQRLLADDHLHEAARAAGLEHARGFTWERTADAVRARLLPDHSAG